MSIFTSFSLLLSLNNVISSALLLWLALLFYTSPPSILMKASNVPIQSIRQGVWPVTNLTKFWFHQITILGRGKHNLSISKFSSITTNFEEFLAFWGGHLWPLNWLNWDSIQILHPFLAPFPLPSIICSLDYQSLDDNGEGCWCVKVLIGINMTNVAIWKWWVFEEDGLDNVECLL